MIHPSPVIVLLLKMGHILLFRHLSNNFVHCKCYVVETLDLIIFFLKFVRLVVCFSRQLMSLNSNCKPSLWESSWGDHTPQSAWN